MKKHTLTLAVASALLGMAAQVQAAGFQLAETSATGLGRAFAGEAAMADNASAQVRNPAMLTQLQGTQISGGGIMVMPNVDIHGHATQVMPSSMKPNDLATGNFDLVDVPGSTVASSAEDVAGNAFIPNLYLSHQLDDQLFIGLAVGSNYGMSTELQQGFRGTQFGNEASIKTVELNPNIAYRINDQFSIGGGVRFVMGKGSIGATSSVDTQIPLAVLQHKQVPGAIPVPMGTTLKYMEGDDTAWGWQAGAAWQLDANNRIGFNYRSAVDLKLAGHANGFAFNPLNPSMKFDGSMELTLPATAEISSFNQLTDKLAMHASVNWTDWSAFDKLEADIPALGNRATQLVKQENWHDSYRFALGATYNLDRQSLVRVGVAYDKSAVDENTRTMTIPEMNRYWFSAGYGYKFTENFNVDMGLTYIVADKANVSEPRPGIASDRDSLPFGGSFSGTTEGNILLFGLQASYKF
ncbi:aromatic hydrocarbon degradation protein [Shewanella sp. NFH-SH190041]|uniref:outer membrane protein transport protein n=1 Tax=Shewanella sp. NFH-SH190041 TaxID=2950245 RepID=UPI0021C2A75C|nr:outer membrane protein transport protein [Shewanella sp. NFH-SH190041]BDM66057.1 aromatic hydrocarbon degradation protein [Shewanella sp. NFH-SH190041]